MALLTDYDYHGNIFNESYVKVGNISGSKDKMQITVDVYKSQSDANASSTPLDRFAFVMNYDDMVYNNSTSDKNHVTQAYNFLKQKSYIVTTDGRQFSFNTATDV